MRFRRNSDLRRRELERRVAQGNHDAYEQLYDLAKRIREQSPEEAFEIVHAYLVPFERDWWSMVVSVEWKLPIQATVKKLSRPMVVDHLGTQYLGRELTEDEWETWDAAIDGWRRRGGTAIVRLSAATSVAAWDLPGYAASLSLEAEGLKLPDDIHWWILEYANDHDYTRFLNPEAGK